MERVELFSDGDQLGCGLGDDGHPGLGEEGKDGELACGVGGEAELLVDAGEELDPSGLARAGRCR